jgi:thiol-disulfide isomerase/thioredoxin
MIGSKFFDSSFYHSTSKWPIIYPEFQMVYFSYNLKKRMLLEFYGEECPHCIKMKPLIEQLEKELGVTVEKFEVWHNEENRKKIAEYDTKLCGGVPFFFNTESKKFLCGGASYEELKAWAVSK